MEKKASASTWIYWTILIIITLAGFYGLSVRLTGGMTVTGLTSIVNWGLWISLYIFFIGVSAGAFLLSTLIYVFGVKKYEKAGKIAVFTALLALLGGLGFVSIDLGHIERFFFAFISPSVTSVLTFVIYFYMAYVVLLVLELVFLLRKKKSETAVKRDRKIVRNLGIVGIFLALAVHGGTGTIFAVVKAQPYWFSGLFPVIFIISAMASGSALIAFIYAFFGKKDKDHASITKGIAKFAIWFLIIDLSFIFIEFFISFYSKVPEGLGVLGALFTGSNWWIFWIIQILIGVVIPFIILFSALGRSPKWIGTASLLIVIGVLGVRWNIVVPPLTVSSFSEIAEVISDPRLVTEYVPSLIEWLSSIGIIGFIIILFSLGYRWLPLVRSIEEKRGV